MPDRKVPFGWWWPLIAGAVAGIALRLAFSGRPGEPFATMMAGFIYFSPLLVGAVTVYVAERKQRRTWKYYFIAPFVANCLYVAGTLAIMIEGLICAIVIIPLFAALGGLGGLAMGAICRYTGRPKPPLYCFAALPFLVGVLETNVRWAEKIGAVERHVVVDAPPHIVWKQILSAPDIRPEEIEDAWMFRIGVPLTYSGVIRQTPDGPMRRVTMGKDIYFDEVITDLREPRYLRWTYRYYGDSFPPQALDDHVKLGGHYFDITDTSYTLTPRGRQTVLRVQMHYRVSTRFNWYADPVARMLLGNLAGINLDYYRARSEGSRTTRS
jgi:uncharacterized protein YndB with AHSA1/START domain